MAYHESLEAVLAKDFLTNGNRAAISRAVDDLQSALDAVPLSGSLAIALLPCAEDRTSDASVAGSLFPHSIP